tara:strand:- start:173 stop:541 length:369 start_codon:yes stop_codon:yes gene_type:complete
MRNTDNETTLWHIIAGAALANPGIRENILSRLDPVECSDHMIGAFLQHVKDGNVKEAKHFLNDNFSVDCNGEETAVESIVNHVESRVSRRKYIHIAEKLVKTAQLSPSKFVNEIKEISATME